MCGCVAGGVSAWGRGEEGSRVYIPQVIWFGWVRELPPGEEGSQHVVSVGHKASPSR